MENKHREQELCKERFSVVILAAGYSSRMGAFKALLPVGEKTAVETIVDTARSCQPERIFLVTGHQAELLAPVIQRESLTEVKNPDYEQGMFTSIRAGVKAHLEAGGGSSLLLWPVDCPLVPSYVVEELLAQQGWWVPCFQGKKGHPLLIPPESLEGIVAYSGENGLKGFLEQEKIEIHRLETGREEVVLDMDTPEAYKEMLDFVAAKEGSWADQEQAQASRQDTVFNGRLFLVRHGETKQHEEPIFIGQQDIPLNDLGRNQALKAGLELADYKPQTDIIYTSDLQRAKHTAEIIATTLNLNGEKAKILVEPTPELREMALGPLEGISIGVFKQEQPEEYKRRGENLVAYKKGNDGENFYDLQYRVMKYVNKLMEKTAQQTGSGENRDIVLIAHAGVIRVILANLLGYSLEEALQLHIPKGALVKVEPGADPE